MADVEAQKFSISLVGTRKTVPSTNPLKRSHASIFEDDEDEGHNKKAHSVTHFDLKAGGAIDENRPKDKGPLIIKAQANRDWKEAGRQRRQQRGLPENEDQAQIIADIEAAERREKERNFGLNVTQPVEAAVEDDAVEEMEPDGRERNADERAMDALLGIERESTLVVPAVAESEVFQHDFRSAPDGPTLDDYTRVPVEEFGAAMLRGMGWKGAKAKAVKAPERRPALLGIGAKGDSAMTGEIGGWGKAARGKEPVIYNPVLLKDKKTGELFTEAEAQKRQEQSQRQKLEDEARGKERPRHRDDDTKHGREKRHPEDRRSRSERDRSRDRYHKERSNGKRYESARNGSRERDKPDRHRARQQDSGREQERDRHRERDKQHNSSRDEEKDRQRESGREARDRERYKQHNSSRDRSREQHRIRQHEQDRVRQDDSGRSRARDNR